MRHKLGERDRKQDAQERRDQRPPPEEQGDGRERGVVSVQAERDVFVEYRPFDEPLGIERLACRVVW